ncbi:MAG: stage II sporulation protein P [Clostridia bacterium]|nr:stage II sporulation protein P [Clostridia bacterium]
MIRVSVISSKDLIKKAIKIGFTLCILVAIVCIINYSKDNLANMEISADQYISCISEELTIMGNLNQRNIEVNPERILDSELRASKSITSRNSDNIELSNNNEFSQNQDQQSENSNTTENENKVADKPVDINDIQEVNTNVSTEVIKSTYKETYNFTTNGVKIKNETGFNLDEMKLSTTNVKLNNKNVIIFHTHTCESYTPTEKNKYESSGNFRTLDLSHSVSKVGDVLQTYLNSYGFKVIHDKTYHDYPSYTGSYGRSLKTVSDILTKNKDTDIIIDLHRDAMSDESYAPKVKIGDEYVSQIMFVIGTDGSGLEHDNWKQNLEFAIKVQQKGNEMYPGLFKPIILRNARYNQHLGKAATIIEFGATGNTLEECEGAAKYLAKVLEQIY